MVINETYSASAPLPAHAHAGSHADVVAGKIALYIISMCEFHPCYWELHVLIVMM